jgi:glutamine amidotransferase PdxT
MPISGSTSEKHFRTRTAAATEDKRELLDAEGSEVMGECKGLTVNGKSLGGKRKKRLWFMRIHNARNSIRSTHKGHHIDFPFKRTPFLIKES